jgi:glycosyltransferase involved in cell wall biosynthesis
MDNPIRVLQVLASLDRGGAEAMIMSLYRNIDRNKVQFDFVVNESTSEYAHEAEIRRLGGRIFHVPRYTISNYTRYKKEWIKLLNEHPEWKIIHGHHTSPAFIYLNIAKKHNRVTIAHSHIAGCEKSLKAYSKVILRYPLRYISKYMFACSAMAATWMFGKHSKSTYVLNNAIDSEKFIYNTSIRNEVRKNLQIEDKFVVGHIGRFNLQKNHKFLIEIFNKVHDSYSDSVLLLVGDGELRASIEKQVAELGLKDSVIFLGSRSDVTELLQAMDVFTFPSLYEGLGIVAIEAQAAGMPTIVAETIPEEAYITELIEKEYLSSSPAEWANRILKYSAGFEREDTSPIIKSNGYDIRQTASWIQNFYLNEYVRMAPILNE